MKKGHATWLAGKVCRRNAPGQIETLPDTLTGTVEHWQAIINTEHTRFIEIYQDIPVNTSDPDPRRTIIYRFEMLREIEAIEIDNALINNQINNSGIMFNGIMLDDTDLRNENLSKFTILPVPAEGRKFIDIMKKGFVNLKAYARKLRRVHPNNPALVLLPLFDENEIKAVFGDSFSAEKLIFDNFFNRNASTKFVNGRTVAKGWKLSPTIKTNGISLHILFETANTKRSAGNQLVRVTKEKQCTEAKFDPKYLDANIQLLGELPANYNQEEDFRNRNSNTLKITPDQFACIDPGNHNPFAAVYHDGEHGHRFETKNISRDSYNRESGRNMVNKAYKKLAERENLQSSWEPRKRSHLKQSSYSSRLVPVEEVWNHLEGYLDIQGPPTYKPGILDGIKLRFQQHDEVHRKLSNRNYLRTKCKAEAMENRAMHQVINKLLRVGETKADGSKYNIKLLVFGDCSRLSGFKGAKVNIPYKRIYRLAVKLGPSRGFRAKLIDEGCTSCNSHCCPGYANIKAYRWILKDVLPGEPPTWKRQSSNGLLICQGCDHLRARDIVGAINIHHAATAVMKSLNRPWWLLVKFAAFPTAKQYQPLPGGRLATRLIVENAQRIARGAQRIANQAI